MKLNWTSPITWMVSAAVRELSGWRLARFALQPAPDGSARVWGVPGSH